MTPQAVMLFAAGLGTRMRPLTDDRPKALVEIAGRPLIEHALAPAEAAGIPRRVVNLHWKGDMMRAALTGRDVIFSDESDELLETGGGLRKALPLLGEAPVFTMNTDAVWQGPNPFDTLAAAWNPARMEGLVLVVPPARAIGHTLRTGFAIGADGRAAWRPENVYTGAQILSTHDLADFPPGPFSVVKLWERMLARGTLYAVAYPGRWCDVGHPGAIALAEDMLGAPA